MPVTYEDIHIEPADEYFLVPIKENESIFYLGKANRFNAFKIAVEASMVTATGGVGTKGEDLTGTKCYMFLDTDSAGIKKILEDVNAVLERSIAK